MPMSCIQRDLKSLLASSHFGEADGTVTWKGLPIIGAIFDDEDVEIAMQDGTSEVAHQAVLTSSSSQFPGIADKDPVTIGARNFKVKYWMDDGTGMIDIYLVKA